MLKSFANAKHSRCQPVNRIRVKPRFGSLIFLVLAACIQPVFAESCTDVLERAKVRYTSDRSAKEYFWMSWNGDVSVECTRTGVVDWTCGGRKFIQEFKYVRDKNGADWRIRIESKYNRDFKCERASSVQFVSVVKTTYSGVVEGAQIPVSIVHIEKTKYEVFVPSF